MIFDRSWYNRAGVERVMGFCSEEQAEGFLKAVPMVERAMVDSGIILLKYWLEVSPEEQQRRLESRVDDGRKIWKLSPMDIKSYHRWDDYTRARDEMFKATDTPWAPWYRRQFRGQEARAPESDQPPAQANSLRGTAAGEGQTGQAENRQVQVDRLSVQDHCGEILRI